MNTDGNQPIATLYRKKLGETLRKIRLQKGYSIPDIIYLTGFSKSTVMKVESGEAKTIDSYINYAASVEYQFATFNDFNIKIASVTDLPPRMLESVRLTSKLRQSIIESNFLSDGRTVAKIREELAKLKQINLAEVSSTDIAGVMRNLANDNVVKVGDQDGRKNKYVKVE